MAKSNLAAVKNRVPKQAKDIDVPALAGELGRDISEQQVEDALATIDVDGIKSQAETDYDAAVEVKHIDELTEVNGLSIEEAKKRWLRTGQIKEGLDAYAYVHKETGRVLKVQGFKPEVEGITNIPVTNPKKWLRDRDVAQVAELAVVNELIEKL